MLREILDEAALKNGFISVQKIENLSFYMKSDAGSERYLIFFELPSLLSIDAIQDIVLQAIPDSFKEQPAYSKNCDLLLIHKFAHLIEYQNFEDKILSYEEDPFHFKKYFLYFIRPEEDMVRTKNFEDLESIVGDQAKFSDYKKSPLQPSVYGLAARIFIKLPFLEMPRSEHDLVPLSADVDEAVAKAGLKDLNAKFNVYDVDPDIAELLTKDLINDELENLKASDSSI